MMFTKFAIMGWICWCLRMNQSWHQNLSRVKLLSVANGLMWKDTWNPCLIQSTKSLMKQCLYVGDVFKSLPLNLHLLNILGNKMESVYKALLLLLTVQWLSWGNCLFNCLNQGLSSLQSFSFKTILTCQNNSISLIIFRKCSNFL